MQITLNITEDSNVEVIRNDECKAVQGECCITDLTFVFPETIKGIAIDEFTKHIEFGECKKYGECKKFLDELEGDTYELNDVCTQFEKIMVQVVLTKGNVIWKSLPFMLEFHESINAEGDIVIQTQILHLQEIKDDWQAYIKAHTLRIIKRVGDIPTAEATSLGDTIFYLGANCESPYLMTYGHYYACNFANGVYEWTDLTQDPSLEDVANGVREISRNQTLQFWKNTAAEFKNEVPQENTLYLIEDEDKRALQHEILAEMAADPTYNLAYPITQNDGETLIFDDKKIPLCTIDDNGDLAFNGKRFLFENIVLCDASENTAFVVDYKEEHAVQTSGAELVGGLFEVEYMYFFDNTSMSAIRNIARFRLDGTRLENYLSQIVEVDKDTYLSVRVDPSAEDTFLFKITGDGASVSTTVKVLKLSKVRE